MHTVEPVEENSFVAVESKYSESIGVFSTTGQSCNTAVPVCNGEFVLTHSVPVVSLKDPAKFVLTCTVLLLKVALIVWSLLIFNKVTKKTGVV